MASYTIFGKPLLYATLSATLLASALGCTQLPPQSQSTPSSSQIPYSVPSLPDTRSPTPTSESASAKQCTPSSYPLADFFGIPVETGFQSRPAQLPGGFSFEELRGSFTNPPAPTSTTSPNQPSTTNSTLDERLYEN